MSRTKCDRPDAEAPEAAAEQGGGRVGGTSASYPLSPVLGGEGQGEGPSSCGCAPYMHAWQYHLRVQSIHHDPARHLQRRRPRQLDRPGAAGRTARRSHRGRAPVEWRGETAAGRGTAPLRRRVGRRRRRAGRIPGVEPPAAQARAAGVGGMSFLVDTDTCAAHEVWALHSPPSTSAYRSEPSVALTNRCPSSLTQGITRGAT
jgi:hypothetical protein